MSTVARRAATSPVVVRTPAPRTDWARVAAADRLAMPTQQPWWTDMLARRRGWRDASRLYVFEDATMVLPATARGAGLATILESMPDARGFGGLVSDGPVTTDHVRVILEDLAIAPMVRTRIRPNPLRAATWTAALDGLDTTTTGRHVTIRPAHAHIVDLRRGQAGVEAAFHRTTRRMCRRASASDIVVERSCGARLMEEFMDLLDVSVDRWARRDGEPVGLARLRRRLRDPRRDLLRIAAGSDGALSVLLARRSGRAIAGIVVLTAPGAAHYTRGATDVDAVGNSGASHLLHLHAITDAVAGGAGAYHMGESAPGSGLARFKEGFGAVATPYPDIRIERLPLTAADARLRRGVRRVLGVHDAA